MPEEISYIWAVADSSRNKAEQSRLVASTAAQSSFR